MKVGLFVPCYIDQFYPQVAVGTLQLLQRLGCQVQYPPDQTCCGQPMANSGFASLGQGCNRNFIKNFSGFDYIVAPSGSCVLHIKEHLHDEHHPAEAADIRSKTHELTAFLTDVMNIKTIEGAFPFTVGIHTSCHGQRMLHLSSMSEKVEPAFSKAELLLQGIKGLKLLKTVRADECCGFGTGMFILKNSGVALSAHNKLENNPSFQ